MVFKRRNLSELKAMFIPLCGDCGELDDIAIDSLFTAMHNGREIPRPCELTRLIEEANRAERMRR
jgi:hypothetical protein